MNHEIKMAPTREGKLPAPLYFKCYPRVYGRYSAEAEAASSFPASTPAFPVAAGLPGERVLCPGPAHSALPAKLENIEMWRLSLARRVSRSEFRWIYKIDAMINAADLLLSNVAV